MGIKIKKKKKSTKKDYGRKPLYIAIGFFVLAVAIGIGFWVYADSSASEMTDYEYIFPNVYVAGVNVGGLTTEQALERISDVVQSSYSVNTLTVRLPDRTLRFTPEQTKIVLDAEEAVAKAYAYGRDGSKYDLYRAYQQALKTEHYIDIETDFNIDYNSIRETIDKTAAEIQSEMKDSSVTVGEDEIVIVAGSVGRTLDADALYNRVIDAFMNNDFTPIEFSVDTVSPKQVDLDTIYWDIYVESVDAGYDKETGEITPEVVGRSFDLEAARQQLMLASEGSELRIKITADYPESTIALLEGLLFRDILNKDKKAVTSTLQGSNANRTTNVTLVCNAIDGTILQPGETFSFNNVVGERTADKGYLKAGVYVNGTTEDQTGGGVCQVASTLYYASLLANLEIVEREEHMFLVTYVPMGMDATVYWGTYDYKFRNNTDYPIRINTSVENSEVRVTFYGTNVDGSYVEMEGIQRSSTAYSYVTQQSDEFDVGDEKITQYPYTGYTADTYRKVYNADGSLLSNNFEDNSIYQKRDQITVVGTRGAEGAEGEEGGEGSEGAETSAPVESTTPSEEPSAPVSSEPVVVPSTQPDPQPSSGTDSVPMPGDDDLPFEILG